MKLPSNYRIIERDENNNIVFNSVNIKEIAARYNFNEKYFHWWMKTKYKPDNVEIIKRGREVLYMVVTRDKYELPMCVGSAEEVADFLKTTVNGVRSTYSHQKSDIRGNKYSGRIRRVIVFMDDPFEE